jgi:hypothetical protein
MVPKLRPSGKSFKSLARYLLHDPDKATTSERVSWTHTLNMAADSPSLAVDEMLWTVRAAEDLKRQAGVRAGGRHLENPVKHFALNWHPSEAPTREHMIATVESFLAHMGWKDHQALIVCHTDKHPHVHVMLNSVHPETGKALDAGLERRRAQAWAKRYEREQGMILCEERLKPKQAREKSPTREAWQRMKGSERAFDRSEAARMTKTPDYFARYDTTNVNGREWEALKGWQRQQREQFFVDGKAAYRAVRNATFKEVRAEFRHQWNAYYAAMRSGDNRASLAEMKVALMAAQNRALDERSKVACDALREQRDLAYEAILTQQRVDRRELGERQAQGLRTYHLFDALYPAPEPTAPSCESRPAWQTFDFDPAGREGQGDFFRAGQAASDPVHRRENDWRAVSGVVQRGRADETAIERADGFGGVRKDPVTTTERQLEEQPARASRKPNAEITDAVVSKEPSEKAREMNEREAVKDRNDQHELLASWARSRRSRGRWD